MGENSDGDAGPTLSTDASESEEVETNEDGEESLPPESDDDGPDRSSEENSHAEADDRSDAPETSDGSDDETESGGGSDADDGYEVSSDYEILPEGTDEADLEAEDEYDYAADAGFVDGDERDESDGTASADAEPDGVDSDERADSDSDADPDEDGEFREESDGGETASGSGMMAYESPDVSLDPDDLDPDDELDPDDGLEPDPEEPFDPIQDEEMPLAAHIEEMVKRLAIVVLVAGAVSLIVFLTPTGNGTAAERSINFLWDSVLPADTTTRPTVYGPLSLIMTEFKVASLAGVIVAMPVLVYESYQFMKPGLYPHERRYYLAAVPTSLVLAVVGTAFAYRPVLPLLFQYFFRYTRDVTEPAFGLSKTFNLILAMMGYFAVIFQIPLFIMLAIMMGVTTREWLASRRLYFWGAFLGTAFFFVAVDPTGVAPILIAGTMILLFEGTLFLLKWTGS